MKVKTDYKPLFDHSSGSFYEAAADTLRYAQAIAPVDRGDYRDSLRVWRRNRATGPTARIGSRLPYAGALDRGAGPHAGWAHRGPHIVRAAAPKPLQRSGAKFRDFYQRRLGSMPLGSSATSFLDVGHGLTYERQPTELSLVG